MNTVLCQIRGLDIADEFPVAMSEIKIVKHLQKHRYVRFGELQLVGPNSRAGNEYRFINFTPYASRK
jgi:hypothetical protein